MDFPRSFLWGVSGSPIAASTIDRANRLGSVGFFLTFFFGFGMSPSCQSRELFASPPGLKLYQYRPLLIIGFMEKMLYTALINFGGIDVRSER
jgi:hypothetical protein